MATKRNLGRGFLEAKGYPGFWLAYICALDGHYLPILYTNPYFPRGQGERHLNPQRCENLITRHLLLAGIGREYKLRVVYIPTVAQCIGRFVMSKLAPMTSTMLHS